MFRIRCFCHSACCHYCQQHWTGLSTTKSSVMASKEYGFGVSARACGRDLAAQTSRLAERRGDYVFLVEGPTESVAKSRLGTPHELPGTKPYFRIVISARRQWDAHSGVLESFGLLTTLRWLTRSSANQHRRVTILVNAKTVIGAAKKGRSSSHSLKGPLRAIVALTLAADLFAASGLHSH